MSTPNDAPATPNETCEWAGKVLVVTGGGHGIGEAAVKLASRRGAKVATLDLNAAAIGRLNEWAAEHGADLLAVAGDAGEPAAIEAFFEAVLARWGRLDGWVNNALLNTGRTFETETEETMQKAWEVNTLAVWRAARLGAPHLERTGGAIVNVSSIMSRHTMPYSLAYSATKGAMEAMTRALAVSLAPRGVRVNCVRPGLILTQPDYTQAGMSAEERATPRAQVRKELAFARARHFQPIPRPGQPEEAAEVILFLLSPRASFVTGASLDVDGGYGVKLTSIYDPQTRDGIHALDEIESRGI